MCRTVLVRKIADVERLSATLMSGQHLENKGSSSPEVIGGRNSVAPSTDQTITPPKTATDDAVDTPPKKNKKNKKNKSKASASNSEGGVGGSSKVSGSGGASESSVAKQSDSAIGSRSNNSGADAGVSALEDELLCPRCKENDKTAILLPCFHVATCDICAAELAKTRQQCPLCTGTVNGFRGLFA